MLGRRAGVPRSVAALIAAGDALAETEPHESLANFCQAAELLRPDTRSTARQVTRVAVLIRIGHGLIRIGWPRDGLNALTEAVNTAHRVAPGSALAADAEQHLRSASSRSDGWPAEVEPDHEVDVDGMIALEGLFNPPRFGLGGAGQPASQPASK